MKNYIILFASVVTFISCSNEEQKTADTPVDTVSVEAPAPVASNVDHDPVCGMEKDTTWVDYTVHNADTVWFCSETCKTAFTGNPEKYLDKKS